MANNYTPSYNQYLTQTADYALPSSVKTYSVFDPASNSWRRMTNDGRSPMPASPAQQQADIAGALAQARQTQGTVYPAQGMGQGQPVEVHPGYLNPPAQAPTPVHASRQTVRQNAQPSDIGLGVTVTHVNNSNPYAKHANENPVMPLTQPKSAARTLGQYLKRNFIPATTGTVLIQQPQQESNAVSLREDMLSPVTRMRLENANISNNLGRALASAGRSLGNGFFTWLGLNKPTNLDPYLSNHSDPRW